jgi:K+-transporting ATPase ATPase B chain
MGLATPASAILSAVIFNALIIVALIPLALRGVLLPFPCIKVIDLLLSSLGLA